MLIATLENPSSTDTIGPGQPVTLPPPFDWLELGPLATRNLPVTIDMLIDPDKHTGFAPGAMLQQYVQNGLVVITFSTQGDHPVGDEGVAALGGGGGGGGLPPFVPEQYAVLMENPAANAVFQRLTEDMILPSFGISLSVVGTTIFEIGQGSGAVSFSASYVRPAEAATIDDGSGPVPLVSPFTAITLPGPYTETAINASQSFILRANEPGSPTVTDTAYLRWQPLVFWGESVPPGAYDEAFIEGLGSSALDNNRQRTIAYNAPPGEKLYHAFPTVYGTPTYFDADTGFAAGFSKVATTSVTNAYAQTNSYDVYESDQSGLGAVSIRVA